MTVPQLIYSIFFVYPFKDSVLQSPTNIVSKCRHLNTVSKTAKIEDIRLSLQP